MLRKKTHQQKQVLRATQKHSLESKLSHSNVTNAIISFSNHVLPTEWGEIFHQCFINSNLRENNGIMVKSNFFENVVIISPLKLKRNCAHF